MTSELTQITNLIKSKSEKVENICYKEVHKIKLEKRDGNNPIVFNTKSILTNIVDYSNSYIEFQFGGEYEYIKFVLILHTPLPDFFCRILIIHV